jgi:membrane-associated phospholipid phosphatase
MSPLKTTLAVLGSLVGTNFHFLSDIITGAFVGASTGLMVAMLFARRASYRS